MYECRSFPVLISIFVNELFRLIYIDNQSHQHQTNYKAFKQRMFLKSPRFRQQDPDKNSALKHNDQALVKLMKMTLFFCV